MNAAQLLWRTAALHPDRCAIVEEGTQVDYATLLARADAVTSMLRTAGVERGDRIGIFLDRGADAIAAFFGVLAAGGVAVVANEVARTRQLDHILADAGVDRLISTPAMLGRLPHPLAREVALLGPPRDPPPAAFVSIPVSLRPCTAAQIIYTSGSTGDPKGVVVGHDNLMAAATTVSGYLGIEIADRILSLLPLSAVYGMSQVLCAVATGAALVIERSPLPREIVATMATERISVAAAVPALWSRLVSNGGLDEHPLPALRIVTNAGGHLPVSIVAALRRILPEARLFLMYGLTEAMRASFLPPEEAEHRPTSIGRAIPAAEIRVLDDEGSPVIPGEVGELVIRGPTVTKGYWNAPERTAQVFREIPGWTAPGERAVFSGDLVREDDAGFLHFIGRKDRIIKSMGHRIGPDEVIDVLCASGAVAEAAVVGEPDPVLGERVVAHLVLRPGASCAEAKTFCTRELPRFMRPVRYVVHGSLPLLPGGKHDLAALQAG